MDLDETFDERQDQMSPQEIPDQVYADTSKKSKTRVIVSNQTLDLDAYIANYTGHAKINRLLFVAERCPGLAIDAYKLAVEDLLKSAQVQKYSDTITKLNEILTSKQLPTVNIAVEWMESTTKEMNAEALRLDTDLKHYKANQIKESIRMGLHDMGDHYYKIGELENALKSYMRTRDYCTSSKNILDMCFAVIRTCMELGQLTQIPSYIAKAEVVPNALNDASVAAQLKCYSALVELEGGRYQRAAKLFLEIPFSATNYIEDLSPNDIALYGGLCSLVSFDRAELKTKIFDNAEFKQYLELETQVREMIRALYHAKYADCLALISKMKPDLLLNSHISDHVEILHQHIRRKALVQYFQPFVSVDMTKMAKAFNTSVEDLESELVILIKDEHIQARIDSHNKILRATATDQRHIVFEKTVEIGRDYLMQMKLMLKRAELIRARITVQEEGRRSQQAQQQQAQQIEIEREDIPINIS